MDKFHYNEPCYNKGDTNFAYPPPPSICCLYYTYVYTVQFHVLHVFLCHAMLYILGVFSSPDMGTVHRSLCHAMLYILGVFF